MIGRCCQFAQNMEQSILQMARTDINGPEYMSSAMYGYVPGHLAWFQNQPRPKWVQYLGSNVVNDFKDAARFLFKPGGFSFKPPRRIGTYRNSLENAKRFTCREAIARPMHRSVLKGQPWESEPLDRKPNNTVIQRQVRREHSRAADVPRIEHQPRTGPVET